MFGDSKLGGKVEDKRSRVTQRKGGRSVASEKGICGCSSCGPRAQRTKSYPFATGECRVALVYDINYDLATCCLRG